VSVVDAGVVVSALLDSGPEGERARAVLQDERLAAPHLLPAEVTNVCRRLVAQGRVSGDVATLALHDLAGLRIALYPFDPLADRVWELRGAVTAYDAWYVALAEATNAPLITLDERLARAPGIQCEVRYP
jgi:predicted nucleic acid-binding protein